MTPELIAIVLLSGGLAGLGVIYRQLWSRYWSLNSELQGTKDLMHQALDNATRADERAAEVAKIHQELLSRPIQAMIPAGAIEAIGNAVVQWLGEGQQTVIFPKGSKPS